MLQLAETIPVTSPVREEQNVRHYAVIVIIIRTPLQGYNRRCRGVVFMKATESNSLFSPVYYLESLICRRLPVQFIPRVMVNLPARFLLTK